MKLISRMKSNIASAALLLMTLIVSACSDGGGSGAGAGAEVGASPRGLLPSISQSEANFNGDYHAGSTVCADCHNADSMSVVLPDSGEIRDVSIAKAWETSVMANSTRDPYWHAVVASEINNFPMLEDTINEKCTVCHAPMANDLSKKAGLNLRIFDKGAPGSANYQQGFYSMDSGDTMFNHAMDGVSCTLCHQMEADNFGTDLSMTGGYTIRAQADKSDRPAYGQYENPAAAYMREQVEFNAQHGPHISTSESCATCHNLNFQPVDANGETIPNAGHFAEQAIYTEWKHSDYSEGGSKAETCQGCHMPKITWTGLPIAAGGYDRPGFSEHVFLGPNTVLQDMFKNFSAQLGIKPGLDFDSAIARNREFLTTSADIAISGTSLSADTLNFDINITNNTGHKLPAGYHSRRVYLHVQVLNENGLLVFESGKINTDGSIVGVAEDSSPSNWEQHYDVISDPSQVQVYQAVVGNIGGERTHSLLDGSQYLKDNRLLPSGMNKQAIQADTTLPASFGTFGAALEDSNFNGGTDTVSYRIPVTSTGAFTVFAELRYQPFSFGHLKQLFAEGNEVDQVDMFRTIYDATTLRDEIIGIASQIIQ